MSIRLPAEPATEQAINLARPPTSVSDLRLPGRSPQGMLDAKGGDLPAEREDEADDGPGESEQLSNCFVHGMLSE